MKKIIFSGFVTVAAMAITTSALASDLNYNYLQGSYVSAEIDSTLDMDGVGFEGSFLISDQVYVTGSVRSVESDSFGGAVASLDDFSLGLGYRYELSRQADVIMGASWVRADVELRGTGWTDVQEDENGYRLNLGLRNLWSPQFETSVVASHSDLYDTELALGALFHLNETFAVNAGYSLGDDFDVWQVGLRLKF